MRNFSMCIHFGLVVFVFFCLLGCQENNQNQPLGNTNQFSEYAEDHGIDTENYVAEKVSNDVSASPVNEVNQGSECPNVIAEDRDKFINGKDSDYNSYKAMIEKGLTPPRFILFPQNTDLNIVYPFRENYPDGKDGDDAFDKAYQDALQKEQSRVIELTKCLKTRLENNGYEVETFILTPVVAVKFPSFDDAVEFSKGSDVSKIELAIPTSPALGSDSP